MSNTFMTRDEVAKAMRDAAIPVVEKMDMETLRKFAAMDTFPIGVKGGILTMLVIACRERLAS